ncbi:hypothetical protein [Kitasatospora viridis]|uniref:LppX_LprAFG lipoprotein n=1 Tax=Kitasatospora viridis TaxID=281105 RepID=A0A561UJC4_9ACTN|nr:hypothetical protein [Kitasatospora viridis]TWF99449.1 hypothetical protein FHX73_113296 [Kitasatospora viridis]
MRITRTVAATALTGLLTVAVAACGSSAKSPSDNSAGKPAGGSSPAAAGTPAPAAGGGDAKAELLAAAIVMAKAGSAKVTVSGADSGTGSSASGELAWGSSTKLDVTEQQSGQDLRVRVLGDAVYLGTTAQPSPLPGGKHWVQLPSGTSSAFQSLPVMLDPAAQLTAAAQSGKMTKAGSEQVAGASADHYTGTVPVNDLLAGLQGLSPAQRAAVQSQLNGNTSVKVEFWLNAKHELVQQREQPLTAAASPSAGAATSGTVTTGYSDLGVQVTVSAPPASDQADPSAALQLLGPKLG